MRAAPAAIATAATVDKSSSNPQERMAAYVPLLEGIAQLLVRT